MAAAWTRDAAREASGIAMARAADPRALVFVAVHHGNFPSLEYLAHALRAEGRQVLAIYLHGQPPAGTFDDAVSCGGSLAVLAAVLRALPSRTIHLQAHGRWSWLSQLVVAVHPRLRVVQELWDWMDAFVDPAHEDAFVQDGVFAEPEIAAMRVSEAWVRTATAGFVHKHGGPALDAVVADKTVPEVRIFPGPPRAWMRTPVPSDGPPWRLVHAGQVKPSTSSRRVFGDLHVLPLVRALTEQGLEVTAYASALGPGLSPEDALGEYAAHARVDARFRLESRIPVAELVDTLHGRHHFGMLLYPFDADLVVGRRHLQTALASKLFAYVAAGLPVLVSPELVYMAELVRTHGIGLVVPRDEIPALASRLAGVDHAVLCEAVARAQDVFCIERALPDLLRLWSGEP